MKRACILGLLVLAACSPRLDTATAPPVTLAPYATHTPPSPATLEPPALVTAERPLPSPTPFTYTVQVGDTLGGIALKFGVELEDLQAANPQISPNTMSVGQVLRIPSDPANPSGEPTPTPAPFEVQQAQCYPSGDQGLWCFVLAHNGTPDFYENVSAQVTLVDAEGGTIASQPALLPLNTLPPDTSLPMTVFFAPGVSLQVTPRVQILTAVRLAPGDPRYLPASTQNVLVQVDWTGRQAQVDGAVTLPAESKAAASVWVAATAYDEQGRAAGFRRWEGGALAPGGMLPFSMMVSSLVGRIDHVELAVEARP